MLRKKKNSCYGWVYAETYIIQVFNIELKIIKETKLQSLNMINVNVYAQVLQNVLDKLDKAYQGFFRRVKSRENAGFPRFKGFNNYDSFTYPSLITGFDIITDTSTSKENTCVKIKPK